MRLLKRLIISNLTGGSNYRRRWSGGYKNVDYGLLQLLYLPSVIVMQFAPGPHAEALGEIVPFTKNLSMLDGKATAYVCSGNACSLSVTDPTSVLAQIDLLKKSMSEKSEIFKSNEILNPDQFPDQRALFFPNRSRWVKW